MTARFGTSRWDRSLWSWQRLVMFRWDVRGIIIQEIQVFLSIVWVAYTSDLPGFRCEEFRVVGALRHKTMTLLHSGLGNHGMNTSFLYPPSLWLFPAHNSFLGMEEPVLEALCVCSAGATTDPSQR